MSKSNPSSVYEYTAGYIELVDERYFFVQMKDNSVSTIESVKESNAIMQSLLPEGSIYLLVDAGRGASSEDDIYEYIAQSEFGNRVKAQAVIVHELAARLMGNLFLRFIKGKRHMKIFSDPVEAKKWLFEQMTNNHQDKKNSKRLLFV